MTAEITILNRGAVALAADSAVTLSMGKEQKVFNTINKVFRLSLNFPVGVMIYGGASILNVPWETIIKLYRKDNITKSFNTLPEYGEDFINFLTSNGYDFFPDDSQRKYIKYTTSGIVSELLKIINDSIEKEFEKNPLTETEIKKFVSHIILQYGEKIESLPDAKNELTQQEIKTVYASTIENVIINIFEKLPVYKKDLKSTRDIVINYFTKAHYGQGLSGIVFAGFGEKDIFPKMVSYNIEAIINNKPRLSLDRLTEITAENGGEINRFAQGEMVATFIEGIDPDQKTVIDSYLKEILNIYPKSVISLLEKELKITQETKDKLTRKMADLSKGLYTDYENIINQYRGEKHVMPLIHMVSLLPKDELATMAKALVNMTSFKQRVSMNTETVGGPIDVAIITKGDGFIWANRKPSFDQKINPHI